MLNNLPQIRGRYTENADLSKTNWFRVGGPAEVLFKPADIDDLVHFLKNKPEDIPVTVLGVGSNIIIRDGGIEGVVIKLGREFAKVEVSEFRSFGVSESLNPATIKVGAAALDVNVATFAAENGIAGLEFLVGIPGTIGGAVKMNGGAYGKETKDVLVEATVVDFSGNVKTLSNDDLKFSYRKSALLAGDDYIVTGAVLRGEPGEPTAIYAKMNEIKTAREESQPIRTRTGGSTFKNPAPPSNLPPQAVGGLNFPLPEGVKSLSSPLPEGGDGGGLKAWQLIDAAGLRGFTIGGAQVSEKHCNFIINTGTATASDLENLILEIQKRVFERSGIKLEPEIKVIGKA